MRFDILPATKAGPAAHLGPIHARKTGRFPQGRSLAVAVMSTAPVLVP
jgi:hypothetical protein